MDSVIRVFYFTFGVAGCNPDQNVGGGIFSKKKSPKGLYTSHEARFCTDLKRRSSAFGPNGAICSKLYRFHPQEENGGGIKCPRQNSGGGIIPEISIFIPPPPPKKKACIITNEDNTKTFLVQKYLTGAD